MAAFWGAHASRVLVSASHRNNLFSRQRFEEVRCRSAWKPTEEKFANPRRLRQHATRVRYPIIPAPGAAAG
jgi:hypothetical protein